MKLLLIDHVRGDEFLGFAMRCQDAGHDVKWYFPHTARDKFVGRGLVTFVKDWRPWMRWADLVVLGDNTHFLPEIDAWRRRENIKVVGATERAAEWELNRTLGQSIFKKLGIPVPPYREFSDYDSAITYVKKEGRPFVSKPIGDEPNKALSYVAKSPADLVYMLQRWKKAQKLKGKFILQEKVDGCEMAVGGWFGPGGFNRGWLENFEHKSLFAGEKGPNTGEMGTVMRYVAKSKLADMVLRPVEAELEKVGYCGYVDVNCIIGEDGTPWPLEFTMRFGWPLFNIQQELHADPIEWLHDLAHGKDARAFTMDRLAIGALVALPDFPYSHQTAKEVIGVPIYGLTPERMKHTHLIQAMMSEAPVDVNGKVVDMPCIVTAGDYVLVASATGDTVSAARRSLYNLIDNIKIPANPFWRIDIGRKLAKMLPICQAQGYAVGMVY